MYKSVKLAGCTLNILMANIRTLYDRRKFPELLVDDGVHHYQLIIQLAYLN